VSNHLSDHARDTGILTSGERALTYDWSGTSLTSLMSNCSTNSVVDFNLPIGKVGTPADEKHEKGGPPGRHSTVPNSP
jgi:hypothetical protein